MYSKLTEMPKKKAKSMRGKGVLDAIHRIVKDNRIVSRGLSLIPHPGAQGASGLAHMLGYGPPKRRKKRAQTGRGIFSDLGGGLGNLAHGIGSGLFGGQKKPSGRMVRLT